MCRLAREPHTEVLEYQYETAERNADAEMCVKLARKALEARRELPVETQLTRAAKLICTQDPILRQFSRTHPQTFMSMMDAEHAGRALEMLEKLARLRKEVERGMSEAEANVHANRLIMERTMRDPTEEEKTKLVFDKPANAA
jgi:hypothetical protein